MSSLDSIVNIVITKDTATLTRVGFGLPAMLTYNTAQTELAKLYGDIDEMQSPTGPFAAGSREIVIATAMFSQNPKPAGVVVLRRATAPLRKVKVTPITDVTAGKPFALFAYSITLSDGVNSETFTFTTDVTPTIAEVVAGLVALINVGTINVLATDNVTDFDLESAAAPGGAATAGIPFTMAIDRSLMEQAESTLDVGIAADLAAARLVNDDWYGLVSDATSPAEITSLAAAIRPIKRIYVAESADDDILTRVDTDIASALQTLAEERTAVFSHPLPHSSPGGAWIGKQLPTDPGTTTWKFKTLTGVAAQGYTSAEVTNLEAKNANYYSPVAGLNMTAEGTVASGEFLDIVRGIDWLEQTMKENVFRPLKVNPKISFTDLGIQTIVTPVEGTLRSAQPTPSRPNSLIAPDTPEAKGFVVTFPRASEVSVADRAARTLPDIRFTALLAGAVHKVQIRGRVSV